MSTAHLIPETWELSGDDARQTLRDCGRGRLLVDAFQRLRFADGFSHARSMAFMVSLAAVQGMIALVGLASALGDSGVSDVIVRSVKGAAPGPVADLLTTAITQAQQAGASHNYLALTFGTLGWLVTATTAMGQLERGLNRLYGVEQDRPSLQKYSRGLVLAVSVGALLAFSVGLLAFGRTFSHSIDSSFWAQTSDVATWPIGVASTLAAIALLFRVCPRRRQPAWSWLAFGAAIAVALWGLATLGLGLFLAHSASFGQTYGPLAGMVALLLWSLLSSMAVFFGAAVAAQLEAVRAARGGTPGRPQGRPVRAGREARTGARARRRLATRMTNPSEPASRVRRTLEGVLGVPATEGNLIKVLRNGDEIFPAFFDAIAGAEHTIDLLTFVYWKGAVGTKLAETLAKSAQSGVRVRVLLDAYGARLIDPASITQMEDNGVQLRWFRPLRKLHPSDLNHRTHRKILIVDEAVGFTGGVGIADEWQGDARNEEEWRDTHFQIEGPAVDGLRAAFLDNWIETDPVIFDDDVDRFPHQPQPGAALVQCIRGESETGWSDAATLFRSLLQLAQTNVRLTTAYFVPDEALTEQICDAATRGVKIEILLPGPHADKRIVQVVGESSYERLLECGVQLWNFQPSMLHAKVMTVDGHIANVGSANLNSRSMALDEEVNIVVIDESVAATLDRHFAEDLERSVRIEPGRWDDRSRFQHLYERVAGPFKRFF